MASATLPEHVFDDICWKLRLAKDADCAKTGQRNKAFQLTPLHFIIH